MVNSVMMANVTIVNDRIFSRQCNDHTVTVMMVSVMITSSTLPMIGVMVTFGHMDTWSWSMCTPWQCDRVTVCAVAVCQNGRDIGCIHSDSVTSVYTATV